MFIDDGLEFWRLFDKLTLPQAAFLIIGLNPGKYEVVDKLYPENSTVRCRNNDVLTLSAATQFRTVYNGMLTAGKNNQLKVEWAYDFCDGIYGHDSSVNVEDLKRWLSSFGLRPAFFFPQVDSHEISEADSHKSKEQKYAFQDPKHPRYTPKLAAVVAAWEAMDTVEQSKNAKHTLKKWLEQNAAQYKLLNQSGKLKKDVIEQLASVANWQPKGGAPKTKGGAPKTAASVALSKEKVIKKSYNSVSSHSISETELPF
ncbi:hypothetical protein [Bartonella doshiae]|uniref:hypothetical protein n=1 Tax=Bartonella doshiae TaxID=33044 RepID=UPI0009427FE8|nr:hypothetical protein [Bartonella doshiae]